MVGGDELDPRFIGTNNEGAVSSTHLPDVSNPISPPESGTGAVDEISALLSESSSSVEDILREPTEEEKQIQRVKAVEKRLAELAMDDKFKKFLEAYKKKTTKEGSVVVTRNIKLKEAPVEYVLNQNGEIVDFEGREKGSKFTLFKFMSQDEEGNSNFISLDGQKRYVVKNDSHEQKLVGEFSFFGEERKSIITGELPVRACLADKLAYSTELEEQNGVERVIKNITDSMKSMRTEMQLPQIPFPPAARPPGSGPAGPAGQQ